MATKINAPFLGRYIDEGFVAGWLKQDGDVVERDELIGVAASRKAAVSLKAPTPGVLCLAVGEKEMWPVGSTLAFVMAPGEPVPVVDEAELEIAGGGKPATPLARRMARELGLALTQIAGTGPGEMVVENDVRIAAGMKPREPAPDDITESLTKYVPFAGRRQVTARRLMESLRNTAQATLFAEVDATELVRFWDRLKAGFELTLTDLLIAAVARALRRHPLLNSTLMGDEIFFLEPVNIGLTVGVEDGVVVAVVHNANLWSLRELALGTRRIAQEAREGVLKVSQMVGATFTITHLEGHGVDAFTSIVHPGEVASLGAGRIAEKLVLRDGQVVSRATLTLSLTIDECIVDVTAGARFLDTLREMLEHPDEYLE